MLKLLDEEYNENGMAELLTRHGRAYDLNIQIFNRLQQTISGWPGGKPNADDSTRPERANPHPKRSLILAPEPQDDVLSMGATLQRLVEHGHRVQVVSMTSGDLRVGDAEASKFAKVLLETSEQFATGASAAGEAARGDWSRQVAYARDILDQLDAKGPFGDPPAALRRLKGLIRRGEARDALQALGLAPEHVRFLDLPFYAKGRYRQFRLEDDDIAAVRAVLDETRPHQIFITGHLADPNSVQGVAWRAFAAAWEQSGRARLENRLPRLAPPRPPKGTRAARNRHGRAGQPGPARAETCRHSKISVAHQSRSTHRRPQSPDRPDVRRARPGRIRSDRGI